MLTVKSKRQFTFVPWFQKMHFAWVKSSVWCYETIKTIYWCNVLVLKNNNLRVQFHSSVLTLEIVVSQIIIIITTTWKKQNKFNLTAGTFSCFFLSGVESFWLSKRYFPEAGVVFGPVGILRIYSYLLCFMNCNSMTRLLFAQVTNS